MKKVILGFLLITATYTSYAQKAAKAVYAELGGPGVASLNFDTRFAKKEDGIGGRIGFGGFNIDGTSAIFLPIGINYIISKDKKHYFELGGGFTYVNYNDDFFNDEDKGAFQTSFGHLNIGYRVQPADGGFFFRAAINPVFGKGFFIPYYAGVGFGYKF